MSPVVDLAHITVRRGKKSLLHDVNLQVNPGEHWVILGANGAGKTTLLQIAAARLFPTSGSAQILGETLGKVDVSELRPQIGFCSKAVASHLPAHETALNAVVTAAYGVTGRWREKYDAFDERRAFQLLNDWGVGAVFDRGFGSLSEGERQRVQIARALMTDPELLLLDEPSAGLDLAGRESLVHQTSRLLGSPYAPATVLVTHHLEDISPHFTHAAMLRDGEVVASGDIAETITAESLSHTFDMPLRVRRDAGRLAAFLAG